MKHLTKVAVLLTLVWTATSARSQPLTNWGESLHGVRWATALTNSVIVLGSTNVFFQCRVQNLSTNVIYLDIPAWGGTSLFLTNQSGKAYELTEHPSGIDDYRDYSPELKPGEIYEWAVPIRASTNVAIGDYHIVATREFFVLDGIRDKLVSKDLKVKIVRP
jgi:hypothetical protein